MVDVFEQRLALPEEVPLIAKLKNEIGMTILDQASPEAKSDLTLLRFLRGYTHDVAEAATAYKAGIEWRTAHNAARWRPHLIMRKDPEMCTFEQIVSHYTDLTRLPHWSKVGVAYPERFFHGHDKYGNPIMVTTHALIENVFALMTVVTQEEYDEFRVARAINVELYLDALSRHFQRLIKCVYIWDLAGMTRSLWKTWEAKCVKQFWADFDHSSAVAFPEQAHRIAAVNVPGWLLVIWKMIKSVIPGRTLKKVYVMGSSGVAEALLKQCEIPAASLPTDLGGTCSIKYIKRPREISDFKMGSIEIPAGSTRTLEFDCSGAGFLYWGMYVHGGKDIIVKTDVMTSDEKSNVTTLTLKIEEFHREAYEIPDRMSGGIIRFQLDNKSNIFFSKTVDFVIAPYPEVFHDVRSSINQD